MTDKLLLEQGTADYLLLETGTGDDLLLEPATGGGSGHTYGLDLMTASGLGKYVVFNDFLVAMDALVGCEVLDRDLTTPPGSPADGDCYIVAATGTGDWAGHDDELAQHYNGAWRFYTLPSGFTYWVDDESTEVRVS